MPRWGQPHTFALHFGFFRVLGSSMEVGRKMWARFRSPNLERQSDDFARTSFFPFGLPERWDFLNLEAAISHQRTLSSSSSSKLFLQGLGGYAQLILKSMHRPAQDCIYLIIFTCVWKLQAGAVLGAWCCRCSDRSSHFALDVQQICMGAGTHAQRVPPPFFTAPRSPARPGFSPQ